MALRWFKADTLIRAQKISSSNMSVKQAVTFSFDISLVFVSLFPVRVVVRFSRLIIILSIETEAHNNTVTRTAK